MSPATPSAGRRPRAALAALGLLALLPVWMILVHTTDARRDIVYWDEFDTALNLVLRLKDGFTPGDFCRELLAGNNGHRMATSRLLFAAIHATTGRLNFAALDWIGNVAIAGACLLLVRSVSGTHRRLLLALLLSASVFNLAHYENFLWSGASIDHFTVVFLGIAALTALDHGGRVGSGLAFGLALLCTLTLAQGLAVWPAGLVLLAASGRGRALAAWAAIGTGVAALYVSGPSADRAELATLATPGGVLAAARYGLAMLGSLPSLGQRQLAPFLGVGLLALLAITWRRNGLRREPLTHGVATFALIGVGLIAAGRASVTAGEVHSRYQILPAVIWAVALFRWLAPPGGREPSLRLLASIVPCLAAFVLAANREHADEVDSWLTCRDLATVAYIRHGADGYGPFKLHPIPDHATHLLQAAKKAGVYELEEFCREQPFPLSARESEHLVYHLEEVIVTPVSASVRGWAGIPGRRFARGAIHVVLQSGSVRRVFDAVTVPRADVPQAMSRPEWDRAGFQFAREIEDLPVGEFRVGLLVDDSDRPEFVLTPATLRIPPPEVRTSQQ
jgi:hypothetical protein